MRKNIIALCALAAFLGLMMLFAPAAFIKVIVIAAGVACIVSGVISLTSVRGLLEENYFVRAVTIRAILCITAGALAIILPLTIAKTAWTVMLYVLAIGLLLAAGLEIYSTIQLKSAGIDGKVYWGEVIVSFTLALVLLIMPLKIGTILIRICGFVVLVTGIAIFVLEWRRNQKIEFTVETLDD